jgi:hypothetical protein
MLGNLDNEIIFKKAFTDKIVFKAFVRDILGIEIEVDKIETEKQFKPKIGNIDFKLDIFAESVDKRIIIEIQRVEYDHNFDRFLHYFLMAITEQQRRSKEYGINQTVYLIVVLTAPYKIVEKNGKPILDEVLLLKLNPRTLKGEERELFGHQSGGVPLVCLNPNHPEKDTPKPIRDWLDLIYQSIYNSGRPVINLQNEGIKRAAELIEIDNISPEELELKKKTEAGKVAKTIYENAAREEGLQEGVILVAKNALKAGMPEETVSQITGLPIEQIKKIKAEMN